MRAPASLRLGFDPDFAPLTYLVAGQPAGRALDIVREACGDAAIKVELLPLDLGARETAAQSSLDGFACMAVTPGRTGLTFSAPYLWTKAALFFTSRLAERPLRLTTPRNGPLYALLLEQVSDVPVVGPAGPIVIGAVIPGAGYRDCLARVLHGDADAAALNAVVGRAMAARSFPGGFLDAPAPLPALGLAVALLGDAGARRRVLDRLDPALEAIGRRESLSPPPGAP